MCHMKTVIKKVKKGDYFTFGSDRLYVRGSYDRVLRRYEYWPYDDIFDCHYARPDRVVYV